MAPRIETALVSPPAPAKLPGGYSRPLRSRRERIMTEISARTAASMASPVALLPLRSKRRLPEARSLRAMVGSYPQAVPWEAAQTDGRRFVEGETRFKELLGTGKWRDIPAVLGYLKAEGCDLNLRAWRALMHVLAESGRGAEAMQYLEEMETMGVDADSATLGHAAVACARGGELVDALAILRSMNRRGMRIGRVYNLVLLAIANGQTGPVNRRPKADTRFKRRPLTQGECDKAVQLVNEMRAVGARPTTLTYNILIAALARSRRPAQEVLDLLAQMRAEKLSPDHKTFVGVVTALAGPDAPALSMQLLEDAKQQIEPSRGLSSVYSAVIKKLSEEGRWEEAAELVDEMRARNVPRDQYTYCCALNACKEAGKWEIALNLLRQMTADGVEPNLVAYNTCIAACAIFGRPSASSRPFRGGGVPRQGARKRVTLSDEQREAVRAGDAALRLVDEMPRAGVDPDVITYGSLMSALGPRGKSGADAVLKAFRSLTSSGSNITPNPIIYVSVIRAYGDKGDWRKAEEMLKTMRDVHGLSPNHYCYSAVIKALANGGQWKQALRKIDEMKQLGMTPNHIVYAAAIGACEKEGEWRAALDTLRNMVYDKPPKSAMTWAYNSVISALGKAQQLDAVNELVAGMKAHGIKPDAYTYACLMRAAGVSGDWEKSLRLLDEMSAAGLGANVVVYNTVIASLSKAQKKPDDFKASVHGLLDYLCGQHVGYAVPAARSSTRWSVLACLAKMYGRGSVAPQLQPLSPESLRKRWYCSPNHEEVAAILARMRDCGLRPDVTTFTSIVSGCRRRADWRRAESALSEMYACGIKPNTRTCNTLLKIYGDAGEAGRAIDMFARWDADGVAMDAFSFDAMVAAMLKSCLPDKAMEYYELQRSRGIRPNDFCLCHVLKAAEQLRDPKFAERLIQTLLNEGRIPDVQVYADAIRACGVEEAGDGGTGSSGLTERLIATSLGGASSSVPLWRARQMYDEAREVHQGEDGRRLYTSILTVCARHSGTPGAEVARNVIADLRRSAVKPGYAAFFPGAAALAGGGDWEEAAKLLKAGAAVGYEPADEALDAVRGAAQARGQADLADECLANIVVASPPVNCTFNEAADMVDLGLNPSLER